MIELNDKIKKAIDRRLDLEIEYVNNSGVFSVRIISDLKYSEQLGNGYIEAFCHNRNETRLFKISNIYNAKIIENDLNKSIQFFEKSPKENIEIYKFNPNKKIFNLFGKDYNQ